jgi:hypothetical protein
MLDTELLEKVLALQGMDDAHEVRRNEHESTVECAARILHVAMAFINDNLGILDQMIFLAALEESRTVPEWRVSGLFE